MSILAPTAENLALVAHALKRGEVVAMPTETVYGLAGDAFNEAALARIFSAKERPTFDPLIVHVAPAEGAPPDNIMDELVDFARLGPVARDRIRALTAAFWPGPLTLVLPKLPRVPDLATSGLDTVAIRMPRHPVARAMIEAAGVPLAAPSANRFGRISPTTASAVFEELGDRIDWIVDGGPCEVGLESTVVAVAMDGTLTLLRPGGIAREKIEALMGPMGSRPSTSSAGLASPGMLESHYAPTKRLAMLAAPLAALTAAPAGAEHAGLLLFSGDRQEAARRWHALTGYEPAEIVVLSTSGDLDEAARGLFAALRALDRSPAVALFAEPCPSNTGLGHAIADRLQRAVAKR